MAGGRLANSLTITSLILLIVVFFIPDTRLSIGVSVVAAALGVAALFVRLFGGSRHAR